LRKIRKSLYKYLFIVTGISIYIIFNLINIAGNKFKIYLFKIRKRIYNNEINFKGNKTLKSQLINNYLSKISDDYFSEKKRERKLFNNYYYLANYFNEPVIKENLRKALLEEASRIKKQIIIKIDIFFISFILNFGNNILIVNNAIFFCEIVGCHKIILNNTNLKRRLLINKPVYNKQLNITIMQGSNIDCKNENIFCIEEVSWNIYYPRIVIPQVRIQIIKSEILRNLPYVNTSFNELYIHIRGGDIFKDFIVGSYSQPPLCFYEKVINNNKNFKKIYIVSIDRSNVVVDALLQKYDYIIHKQNNFEYDLSLLCHGYNIVISVSSFVLSAIKLNDNLKNIWEYDMTRLSEKFFFLHHDIFKFKIKYKIFTMKPSDIYMNKMFKWEKSPEQIKLMLEDKCPNEFILSNQNI